MKEYNKSIEEYTDVQNAMEFAKEQGIEKEKIEIAKNACKKKSLTR